MKIEIFTDGGAIGNPGPAAIAAIIKQAVNRRQTNTKLPVATFDSPIEKKYSEFIGHATNNQAEYKALIFALKKVKQIFGKKKIKELEMECNLDSELVVKQLKGEYKILEKELQPLFLEVWNLKMDFKNVNFNFIHRERNKEADKLVKTELSRSS